MRNLTPAALSLLLAVSASDRFFLTSSEFAPNGKELSPEVRELTGAHLVELIRDIEEEGGAPVALDITDLGRARIEKEEVREKLETIRELPGEAREMLESIGRDRRSPSYYPELSPKERAGFGTLEELGLIASANLSGSYLVELTARGDLALKYAEARDREEEYNEKVTQAQFEAANFYEGLEETFGITVKI